MEEIRGLVDDTVKDPDVAEKLKAYYNQFCKRPTFNDFYLDTFNRPNVELVDVAPHGESRRLLKTASSPTTRSTLLTVLFMPAVLKSPPVMSGVSAFQSLALEANRSMNIGERACVPCTD
ncbi:MAG: hypothetical protein CM15mP120_10200 [Pseudomonadota bacterium]|nr:MAG: hypothetical protein CM15mP120_10200 [Pseudomonadota bacterium]